MSAPVTPIDGSKENVITLTVDEIKKLNVSETIVICDTLNTQVKFAQQLINHGASYCQALKENLSELYEHVKALFEMGTVEAKFAVPHREYLSNKFETHHLRIL